MSFNHPLIAKLKNYKLILGSTSPRRQEILKTNLGIHDFGILGSNFAEDLSKDDKSPLEYVQLTSKHKAEAIVTSLDIKENGGLATLILTCDTIISCNNKVFEKPITKEVQRQFFNYFKQFPELQVISALTLIIIDKDNATTEFSDYTITKLRFKTDDDDDEIINAYIESEEGLEVAGGFKYQELGGLLFESIDGDYLNVVGLPLKTFDLLNRSI